MKTDKDYLTLITSQHQDKEKYMAWVKTLVDLNIDIQKVNQAIKEAFDINTAVGVQLDVLGEILKLPRTVNFQPQVGSSVLTDDYYRTALKAKIIKNQWKGTVTDFYNFWNALFEGEALQIYLIDNQDMQMVAVIFDESIDPMIEDLIANGYIIPKPAGVGLTVRRINSEGIFGFAGTSFQPFNQGVFFGG